MIIIFSIAFYIGCQKNNYEIDQSDNFEFSQKIFSKFDPNLGYAHNLDFLNGEIDASSNIGNPNKDQISNTNGFSLTSYLNGESSFNIVILGASNSEPYLNGGSWPYQLHTLLKKNKISHKIYNGAVSGYNSTQSLVKLIRDVFYLDKINLIIYLGPANDFSPDFGDISKKHPAIHPVTKIYFEHLAKDASIRNKMTGGISTRFELFLSKYFGNPNTDLQLGVENENYLKSAIDNIKYMKAICDVQKIPFVHVSDFISESDSQRIIIPQNGSEEQRVEAIGRVFVKEVQEYFKNSDYSFSLKGAPLNKKIFKDYAHLTNEGSVWVANEIYKILVTNKFLKFNG
jgi:hypothetical protein